MSKPAKPRRLNESEANASLRNLRISPQKLNLIAGLIRGKQAAEALDQLAFSKKRAAKDVHKLLVSALSNAENNHSLDIDKLYVAEAVISKGLVMKRFHARARGRGSKIIKPYSSINLIVREHEGAA